MELRVNNVNQAFSEIFWKFRVLDLPPEQTRNGPAIVYPEMVTTIYKFPDQRVLFHEGRDANPIFHLMESIWMLAGRRDVSFLKQFNKRMADFSDDGINFNAAYGYRWRHHFGSDQLVKCIHHLRGNPGTRQAVIQIWDAEDLVKETIDKACNTQIIFSRGIDGKLDMTVFNRSNDIWWGAYGANAVHFSFLHEFISRSVSIPLGEYRQVSNNFHFYTDLYDVSTYFDSPPDTSDYDHYGRGVTPYPIMDNTDYRGFLEECEQFCDDPFQMGSTDVASGYKKYKHAFFTDVAMPMAKVSQVRKSGMGDGLEEASHIKASDWRLAVEQWIKRRQK